LTNSFTFAVNRMVSPHRPLDDFLRLARAGGAEAVEIRNDIAGQEFADGTPAGELKRRIEDAGLRVASINALQRFNHWTPEREREAAALVRYAHDLGAPGIVLCPVIAAAHGRSDAELEGMLRAALRGLKPILSDHGVIGYVEPLGMVDSTLRHQSIAAAALEEIGGQGTFQICYDTFQHFRASATKTFPEWIGLVHVSGITRTDLSGEELTEPDRGLVDDRDMP
jgi:2-keto-myo-inositol isomerase